MTIKGTLETFNLRELLQMLAFNQKVGTLVLETDEGPRAIYVDRGRAGFVERDPALPGALRRTLLRQRVAEPSRIARAFEIHENSGRFIGEVLEEMGILDEDALAEHLELVIHDRLFDTQLKSIHRFEFMDGEVLGPDGEASTPVEPLLQVDSLLLELTRKVDHWQIIAQTIPTAQEVFEGTGVEIDIDDALEEDIEQHLVDEVAAHVDGFTTLEQLSERSSIDLYSVVQIAAAMFSTGALRPVPTEELVVRADDLIERGRAQDALPLLRLGIERGDAPVDVRLRIADALESTGQREAAAVELDTYAALNDGEKAAPAVFQALQRALTLRGGSDLPTACRLTDFYLRHRPWLRDHRTDAVDALRQLIRTSLGQGRALDAASRLEAFIEAGEMPNGELRTLADLYLAEDRAVEAADVLIRHGEELLATHRTAAGRTMLRQAVDLDPTRADARRRLRAMDTVKRHRRQRRRVSFALILVVVVALGAGGAWWTYNQEAGRAVSRVQQDARDVVTAAYEESTQLLDEFDGTLAKIEATRDPEIDLAASLETLERRIATQLDTAEPAIAAFANEVENYPASGSEGSNRNELRVLENKVSTIRKRERDVIRSIQTRAVSALALAEEANAHGRFLVARAELLRAHNLAFDNPTIRKRADILLRFVDRYIAQFERRKEQMDAARAEDDLDAAYAIGVGMVGDLLDSDLTRGLRFPYRIETTPPGAEVLVDGKPTGDVTPAVIEYSPFEDKELRLRLPGHANVVHDLPSSSDFEAEPDGSWPAGFEARLEPGPRFVLKSPARPFAELWDVDGVPMVLETDGRTVHSVDIGTGALHLASHMRGAMALRLAGTFPGGATWQIRGQRTMRVIPRDGKPWETQSSGRLERKPILVGEVLCVVDEVGNIYGLDIATGRTRWSHALKASPNQRPRASDIGILIATQHGTAFRIHPERGTILQLTSAVRGVALALPFADGALFLGGGDGGCRFIDAQGESHPAGDATPIPSASACVCDEGVGWIEASGVRWMDARPSERQAITIAGLGDDIASIACRDDVIYGVSRAGEMRSALVSTPEKQQFALPLRGTVMSPPLPLEEVVFILVDGDLVAVER